MRQVELVLAALRQVEPNLQVTTSLVRTEGDRRQDVSLEEVGGQGVFVKDIERRLIDSEIDLAVHSLKDMPAETPPGLTIGGVLPRGDARDALVARDGATLDRLAPGARIGSDSRRRAVQILALRPDVTMTSIRGNVDTRLRKVESGDYDAVVLAAAGLERLALLRRATEVFDVDRVLPAVGQAVIAVECRADDDELLGLLARVDHKPTRLAVTAERAFLRRLGAGCRLPVGAYGELIGGSLRVRGLLAGDDGTAHRSQVSGPSADAERLGITLAERLAEDAGVRLNSDH